MKTIKYLILGVVIRVMYSMIGEYLAIRWGIHLWRWRLSDFIPVTVSLIVILLSMNSRKIVQKKYLFDAKVKTKKKVKQFLWCSNYGAYIPMLVISIYINATRKTSAIMIMIFLALISVTVVCDKRLESQISEFKKVYSPEKIVVVMQNAACSRPKYYPLWLIDLNERGKIRTIGEYLFVPEMVAQFFMDTLAEQPIIYEVIAGSWRYGVERSKSSEIAEFFIDKAETIFALKRNKYESAERYLSACDRIHGNNLVVPKSKYRMIDFGRNWQEDLIREYNEDHLSVFEKESLLDVAKYNGSEIGKKIICRMINKKKVDVQTDTEYFYDLLQYADFIIHYRCLADYEESDKKCLDKKGAVSMGSFEAGIIDHVKSARCNDKSYKDAIATVYGILKIKGHRIAPGRGEAEGRKCIVVARNKLVGHGVLAQDVAADIVSPINIILAGMVESFINEPDDSMTEKMKKKINGHMDKYIQKEDGIYLLAAVLDDDNYWYINHENGKMLLFGEEKIMKVGKEAYGYNEDD